MNKEEVVISVSVSANINSQRHKEREKWTWVTLEKSASLLLFTEHKAEITKLQKTSDSNV